MLIDDVRLALEEAAAGQPFRVDCAQAVDRARRIRRRRRQAGGAGALAAAVAIAAGAGVAVTRNGEQPFVVKPAAPAQPPSLASVSGVDVTWLPAGFRPLRGPHVSRRLENGGYGLAQRFGTSSSSRAPYLELDVVRGAVDLNEVESNFSRVATWTTVNGNRALLLSLADPAKLPARGEFLAAAYVLQWVDKDHPDQTLRLEGSAGTTLAQLRRMAEGLAVGPLPGPPADPAAARAAIRRAFTEAFERVNPATVLPAIENGNDLASVVNELEMPLTRKASPFNVRLGAVNFFDSTHAWVDISVSYSAGSATGRFGERASAVLLDGAWKVSETSYCSVVGAFSISCPPH